MENLHGGSSTTDGDGEVGGTKSIHVGNDVVVRKRTACCD